MQPSLHGATATDLWIEILQRRRESQDNERGSDAKRPGQLNCTYPFFLTASEDYTNPASPRVETVESSAE